MDLPQPLEGNVRYEPRKRKSMGWLKCRQQLMARYKGKAKCFVLSYPGDSQGDPLEFAQEVRRAWALACDWVAAQAAL